MDTFILKIIDEVRNHLDDSYLIEKNTILKTNGARYNAISVGKKDRKIMKNIYLEKYYEKYTEGCPMEEIVEEVVNIAVKDDKIMKDDYLTCMLQQLGSYDNMKDKIVIKLINREMNKEYLKDKLYIEYLDLAVTFQILVNSSGKEMASSYVSKNVFENWNVTLKDIYNQALENMERLLPYRLSALDDVILELLLSVGKNPRDYDLGEDWKDTVTPIHVLSNQYNCMGAAAILYKGVLRDFATRMEVNRVTIIPSSVQEVLLIPMKESIHG